jgi:hypothetical protein
MKTLHFLLTCASTSGFDTGLSPLLNPPLSAMIILEPSSYHDNGVGYGRITSSTYHEFS